MTQHGTPSLVKEEPLSVTTFRGRLRVNTMRSFSIVLVEDMDCIRRTSSHLEWAPTRHKNVAHEKVKSAPPLRSPLSRSEGGQQPGQGGIAGTSGKT